MSKGKKNKLKGNKLSARQLRTEVLKLFRRHPKKQLNPNKSIYTLPLLKSHDFRFHHIDFSVFLEALTVGPLIVVHLVGLMVQMGSQICPWALLSFGLTLRDQKQYLGHVGDLMMTPSYMIEA